MIKLVHCVCRRPRLTVAQFRAAWEVFGERLREVAIELGATRVTLSTTLESPLNDALAEARGSARPFDGIAEIVWPSGVTILEEASLPAARAHIARLRVFQDEFVDPGQSAFFFVHEQELLEERELAGRGPAR
jgi:hypothetical protein